MVEIVEEDREQLRTVMKSEQLTDDEQTTYRKSFKIYAVIKSLLARGYKISDLAVLAGMPVKAFKEYIEGLKDTIRAYSQKTLDQFILGNRKYKIIQEISSYIPNCNNCTKNNCHYSRSFEDNQYSTKPNERMKCLHKRAYLFYYKREPLFDIPRDNPLFIVGRSYYFEGLKKR